VTPAPSSHSVSDGRPRGRASGLGPSRPRRTVSLSEAPMVGALFRRLPSREIPPTRMKSWVVIAAAVLAVLAIGLVLI